MATKLPAFEENPLNRIIIALTKPSGANYNTVPVISNIQMKACFQKGEVLCYANKVMIYTWKNMIHNTCHKVEITRTSHCYEKFFKKINKIYSS